MPQIAMAFALPTSVLQEAQRRLRNGDYRLFHQCLVPHEIVPGFAFSGAVIVVLTELLKERGLELPISRDQIVQPLVDSRQPLMCARPPQTARTAGALAQFKPTDKELIDCWQNWSGENDPQIIQALHSGLDWLRQVCTRGTAADWCIILAG